MSDIIRVLPDVVANQIAAGEVIQRPASAIKELVENAVDAGSDRIHIIIKEAGKTLIQIVDNGCGMSENDARLCFERHATSKIRTAEDLFSIRTMGFRGEALASIASVAQLEMKTKRIEDENGTHIRIEGSELMFQQPVACQNGTSIAVKNLFFNVPARRRFLKSTGTELKHILIEFQRIALTKPGIQFILNHNDSEVFNLPVAGLRERIIHLMGKQLDANLVNISANTSIVNISGFIGKPEKAKKTYGEQFFFVNGRFMRHPYLHKAVMKSYESILYPETIPSYFIYLELDPSLIDINIHPTKTEIKFEDERAIFQILQACVKQGLGKFNITPSLDFNRDGAIDIPVFSRSGPIKGPEIRINPDFNPFKSGESTGHRFENHSSFKKDPPVGWETLYPQRNENSDDESQKLFGSPESDFNNVIQLRGKYLITPVKSGLLTIHIRRAWERILYEQYIKNAGQESAGQKLLYPVQFDLNPAELSLLSELTEELEPLGFQIEHFGGQTIIVHSIPAQVDDKNIEELVLDLLKTFTAETDRVETIMRERLARSLAKLASRNVKRNMESIESTRLIEQLFQCENPQSTPGGKKTMTILQFNEVEQHF